MHVGKVSHASCPCVAGKGGCCKHIAALLFQILDFVQLEVNKVPDDFTCTQLLQQWHVPASEYTKSAVFFDHAKFTKATAKKRSYTTSQLTENNPAAAFAKNVTESNIKKLKDGLKAANTCNYFQSLLDSNNYQPFDYNTFQEALPSKKRFTEAREQAKFLYNVEIRDSILNQITIPSFAEVCKNMPCTQHTPFAQEKLFKTKEQLYMYDIECNTRGQSDNDLWFEERRLRLTASNYGLVMKRREKNFPKWILSKQFSTVRSKTKTPQSCQWGHSNEQNAIATHLENCFYAGQQIKARFECRLAVNAQAAWLGASPDCSLYDPSEEKPDGIGR